MADRRLLLSSVLLLAACGGGSDSDPYQQAVDAANQAEAQARMLGVASPCQQSSQCGVLTFMEPTGCPRPSYQVYSLISSSAQAASAAASEELTLAAQAMALNPQPPGPCPNVIIVPPVPVCVANTCQPGP
jgi:hypothetical protein